MTEVQEADGVFYAWREESINDLIGRRFFPISAFRYCMISCVDSNRDMTKLSAAVELALNFDAKFSKTGSIIVRSEFLPEIGSMYELFTGFDEVWFFDVRPEHVEVEGNLLAPADFSRDGPSDITIAWFKRSGCKIGLGDGVGTNCVASNIEYLRF